MRVTSVLLILPFLNIFMMVFNDLEVAAAREIIHFHMLFNVLLAIIFLPLVNKLASVCEKILPFSEEIEEKSTKPLYLDETALDSPTIALQAQRAKPCALQIWLKPCSPIP